MRRRLSTRAPVLLLIALLLLAGCVRGEAEGANALVYTLPVHLTVEEGGFLAGTDIQYLGRAERGARLLIAGAEADKRTGDSLDWEGELLPGATVRLSLRVISYSETLLRVAGTAHITVRDVAPRAATVDREAPVRYSGVVAYGVANGDRLPGTPVRYVGPAPEGAQLAGLDGYPYRKTGDSIVWEGLLRDGVSLALELRVVQYDDASLRVAGVVTLYFANTQEAPGEAGRPTLNDG